MFLIEVMEILTNGRLKVMIEYAKSSKILKQNKMPQLG